MGYRTQNKDTGHMLELAKEYKYALLYMMSELRLCETTALYEDGFDISECLEARFFSEDKELHYFERNGGFCAVETVDDGESDTVISNYALDRRFQNCGKLVRVMKYLDYDEDGQVYVSHTRLCGIE